MITTLHDPVVTTSDGVLEQRIQVTFAPGTLDGGEVSYRVDPGDVAVDDLSVIPLVPPALVLACRLSQDLRVTEPLPPVLHEGARRVAALLHEWYGWRPAELIAPIGVETVRPSWAHRRRGRGVFFTRGVDSWGTLFDRLDGPKRDRPTHLITVDNEVHLDDRFRQDQVDQTRAVAHRLSLPLITVTTDIRTLFDPHTDWGTDTHGSVLAGIGRLLRRTLGEVVIAPTQWTPLQRPWGSHPELEPLWSVPDLRVVHHGGDEPRWRRVERIMAEPIAAQTVQVCWQGSSDRNCGRCEKCLRLMTSLAAVGWMDRSANRFDAPFDPNLIGSELVVGSVPWCDTIDHLDHVGLATDPLRQRWEQVVVRFRPQVWSQTRTKQPRLPIIVVADHPDLVEEQVRRRLAAIGIRKDHEARPDGTDGPHLLATSSADGPIMVTVVVPSGSGGGESVALDAIAMDTITLDDVRPLLDALDLDPEQAVPFDPDGQGPPLPPPPPASWIPGAAPEPEPDVQR